MNVSANNPAGDQTMASASKKTGFKVTCVKCHAEEAQLAIDLNNLDQVTCSDCDEVYSAREARDLALAELAKWRAVCKWIESAAGAMAEFEL